MFGCLRLSFEAIFHTIADFHVLIGCALYCGHANIIAVVEHFSLARKNQDSHAKITRNSFQSDSIKPTQQKITVIFYPWPCYKFEWLEALTVKPEKPSPSKQLSVYYLECDWKSLKAISAVKFRGLGCRAINTGESGIALTVAFLS